MGPKMASEIAPDPRRWLKIISDMHLRNPRSASRRLQVATGPPQDGPKKPTSFDNVRFFNVLCLLAFPLPMGGPSSLFPFGEMITPPPTHSPWVWTGGVAGS